MILLSDTDFLSSFLKIGQLEMVRDFYRTEHLFIASGVYRELSRTDLVTKVDDREWIRVRPVSEAELVGYREEGAFACLGRGEQETIALAGSLKATVLMSDQRAFRFAYGMYVTIPTTPSEPCFPPGDTSYSHRGRRSLCPRQSTARDMMAWCSP